MALMVGVSTPSRAELRAFYLVVGAVLLIPLLVGPIGAFGGLEGLARLFGVEPEIVMAPALRDHLRAVTWMFLGYVPLAIWSLRSRQERAGAFRIILAFAFLAGFARLTGWLVDGFPGPIPLVIMGIELAGMPILFAWHRRLLRS